MYGLFDFRYTTVPHCTYFSGSSRKYEIFSDENEISYFRDEPEKLGECGTVALTKIEKSVHTNFPNILVFSARLIVSQKMRSNFPKRKTCNEILSSTINTFFFTNLFTKHFYSHTIYTTNKRDYLTQSQTIKSDTKNRKLVINVIPEVSWQSLYLLIDH